MANTNPSMWPDDCEKAFQKWCHDWDMAFDWWMLWRKATDPHKKELYRLKQEQFEASAQHHKEVLCKLVAFHFPEKHE